MAQYDGMAIIPAEIVCRDYFRHLDPIKFVAKATKGEIRIPVVRMEGSAKSARGVHLQDLADYLDEVRAQAKKELAQITRGILEQSP
jgi:hypothetical protein